MRSIVGATLAIGACVTWTEACASLEGLGQYYPAVGDASVTLEAGPPQGDDSTVVEPDAVSPGDDQGSSSSSSSSGGGESDSGAPGSDAGQTADASHPHDAGSQPCSKSNCSTCCVDGGCASANANVACGASCMDCTATGKACNNGTCVTTSCNAQSCSGCPVYFLGCCKGTGGCGCSLLFPPGPCT